MTGGNSKRWDQKLDPIGLFDVSSGFPARLVPVQILHMPPALLLGLRPPPMLPATGLHTNTSNPLLLGLGNHIRAMECLSRSPLIY